MSYFVPRPRGVRLIVQGQVNLQWPAAVELSAQLRPTDLFGAPSSPRPRSVVVQGSSGVRVHWDASIGRSDIESSIFLPPLEASHVFDPDITVTLRANLATASFEAIALDDILAVRTLLDYHIPAYLSLLSQTYVGVERMYGVIGSDHPFNMEYLELAQDLSVTSAGHRQEVVSEALVWSGLQSDAAGRLLIATLYYQHALRLGSELEVRIPAVNLAEVLVNLCKAIEVAFGDRDSVRRGCQALGYTQEEIETHIIPLLLARNHLDGAHPTATRPSQEFVATLKEYVSRGSKNVGAVLMRLARAVAVGTYDLPPLGDDASMRDREQLVGKMRSYLEFEILRP